MKEFVLPSRFNKRLISTLMASKPTNPSKSTTFSLKSTSEFASRSGDIFGKLQTLEKNHETWVSQNTTLESFEKTENPACRKLDSEIFKKPMPTKLWKPKCSTTTSFKRRPAKKWKKYSLADVPLTSDASNTAIALQCISELRKRKEKSFDTTDSNEKIVFTKPKQNEKNMNTRSSTQVRGKMLNLKEKRDETKSPKIKLHHLQDDGCDNM